MCPCATSSRMLDPLHEDLEHVARRLPVASLRGGPQAEQVGVQVPLEHASNGGSS
jgi:hypothetical protein